MSGATPELNLATAVDSDDTADYLTLSLADSLRTVDALFNNVTGHNHGGAHQGGAITPAAGSITSGMIADGTIVASDIADQGITNAKLGPDVARANLLTNGGFEIWQRGNGVFSGTGVYTADRWLTTVSASDTLQVAKATGGNADATNGSSACASCAFTLSGGGGNTGLYQALKFSDGNQLLNRTLTLSVRVLSSLANAVRVAIHNGTAYSYSTYHTGSGTYETLTATATVSPSATQVFTTVFFGANGTFLVDNAMLVLGSVPANYVPLHPADDLARCLRYYEIANGPASAPTATGQCFSTTQSTCPFYFRVAKAAVPTINISAPSDFQMFTASGAGAAVTSLSGTNQTIYAVDLRPVVASGLVAGNATLIYGATSNAKISFEANP